MLDGLFELFFEICFWDLRKILYLMCFKGVFVKMYVRVRVICVYVLAYITYICYI